jgi:low affinity Fe/Cu permease
MLHLLLVILLILAIVGAFPVWPYNRTWSYYPSVGTAILVVLIIWLLFGR